MISQQQKEAHTVSSQCLPAGPHEDSQILNCHDLTFLPILGEGLPFDWIENITTLKVRSGMTREAMHIRYSNYFTGAAPSTDQEALGSRSFS